MSDSTTDLEALIDAGQEKVAHATLEALTTLQRALRDSDVSGEDQLALLMHTATVFAVESLHLVIRQLGEGSPCDYEAAVRELFAHVCGDRARMLRAAS